MPVARPVAQFVAVLDVVVHQRVVVQHFDGDCRIHRDAGGAPSSTATAARVARASACRLRVRLRAVPEVIVDLLVTGDEAVVTANYTLDASELSKVSASVTFSD